MLPARPTLMNFFFAHFLPSGTFAFFAGIGSVWLFPAVAPGALAFPCLFTTPHPVVGDDSCTVVMNHEYVAVQASR